MPNRKVLLTGASGYIASQILPAFQDQYDMALVDVNDSDRQGLKVPGVEITDLGDPDLSKYSHHFQDVDTVVHLGYKRRQGSLLDDYHDEQFNVGMAFNVYRSAYESGVKRVVLASSNHAADWYEHALIHNRDLEMLDPYRLPLSDNFYGWAKATYEHLGFLFACGKFGRKLEVVLVRVTPSGGDYLRYMEYHYELGPGSTLARVYEGPFEEYSKESEVKAMEYLRKITADLEGQGVKKVQKKLLHGDAAEAISAEAAEMEHNLVAMTTHGRSGIERWVLGSVADKVVRECGDPVLLIRSSPAERGA